MFHTVRYSLLVLATFLLVVCSGCSEKMPYKVVPFEGTITFKGEPLENVSLEFAVGDYRSSSAFVAEGSQGKFETIHSPGVRGVPIGTCKMTVSWVGSEFDTPPAGLAEVLAKYGYGTDGYVFEVTKAEKDFKIDLE